MMSFTPADSGSPTDRAPREDDDIQGRVLEEDLLLQRNHEGNGIVATEKVACARCRKRKVCLL